MSYESFVAGKLAPSVPTGIAGIEFASDHAFPFQSLLVQWSLRRGRAAIFAATGLGKTRMQLLWANEVARHTGKPVLILAPLAVAQQTVAEASALGLRCAHVKHGVDVMHALSVSLFVTNYDRLHLFEPSVFGGVALDESSIIKHHNAKTLAALLQFGGGIAFRLACTATPAPNDYVELGTHAEFLGICTRAEMLSEFFVHDGGETQVWRLKGHARQAFWRWVASWAALVNSPADLGFDASAYQLPPLEVVHHVIAADDASVQEQGRLFAVPATSLMDRRAARKASIGARVEQCAALVNAESDRWVVWCDLNAEQDALEALLGDDCVSIYGSLEADEKVARYQRWLCHEARILLTKPSIFGWGCNMQSAHHMAFVGVTDSWEAWHQAVRREWRFGQKHPVIVHVFASELEGAVVANLQRKERDARVMAVELSRETAAMVRAEVRGTERASNAYAPGVAMCVPAWCAPETEAEPGLSAARVAAIVGDKAAGFSNREIARRHGVSPSTVSVYTRRHA